jgi:hypothetical protein
VTACRTSWSASTGSCRVIATAATVSTGTTDAAAAIAEAASTGTPTLVSAAASASTGDSLVVTSAWTASTRLLADGAAIACSASMTAAVVAVTGVLPCASTGSVPVAAIPWSASRMSVVVDATRRRLDRVGERGREPVQRFDERTCSPSRRHPAPTRPGRGGRRDAGARFDRDRDSGGELLRRVELRRVRRRDALARLDRVAAELVTPWLLSTGVRCRLRDPARSLDRVARGRRDTGETASMTAGRRAGVVEAADP